MITPPARLIEGSGGIAHAAPVDYERIRPRLQAARAGIAFVLFGLTATAAASGVPGSQVEMLLTGTIVADAVLRIRRSGSAVPSLLIDLVLGGLAVGAGNDVDAPMVSFFVLLLIASLLLLPLRQALPLLGMAPIVVCLRLVWMRPDPGPDASALVGFGELAVYLIATTLILLASVERIHLARAQQSASLAAERRASEIKNEFVSMVSHELRTPLTNIAGFAMTLRETWRDLGPGEVDEFLEIICGEADHLRNVVDDVLAIPRLEAGRFLMDPTPFPLQPAAFRIAELHFPPGGQREASVAVPGGVHVLADPNRVEQILRNLLENARKYGGDHVIIDAERRDDKWVIIVADNGPGVPEDDRERIFEGFEQVSQGDARSSSGLGLGLFITRRIVEAMGGEIWYEPGFPVGSRFCFTLPAVEPQVRSAATGSAAVPAD